MKKSIQKTDFFNRRSKSGIGMEEIKSFLTAKLLK